MVYRDLKLKIPKVSQQKQTILVIFYTYKRDIWKIELTERPTSLNLSKAIAMAIT